MGNIDAQAGLARARTSKTNTPGTCLGFVYWAMGSVQSIGPGAGKFGAAIQGWNYATQRHPGDVKAPAGAVVYFGPSPTRTDANRNAGDVGIALGSSFGPLGWFTDAAGPGRTGIMSFQARALQTRRPYLGWASDFLGHQLVNLGPLTAVAGTGAVTPIQSNASTQVVKDRQNYLNVSFGTKLVVDGLAGVKTKLAIAAYQRVLGVVPDGIWGAATQAAHQRYYDAHHQAPASPSGHPQIQLGSINPSVGQWQSFLKSHYPLYAGKLTVDNNFGPATKAATIVWQRNSGLTPDGVVGKNTWAKSGL